MRKKKSPARPTFPLSKDAQEHRAKFARKAGAKKILNHSCDQTKLEVLYHQTNEKEVMKWLSERLVKMANEHRYKHRKKFGNETIDGSYDNDDDLQGLLIKILIDRDKSTVSKFIKSGEWMQYLDAYIQRAVNGCLTNYYKKRRVRGGKKEKYLEKMVDLDKIDISTESPNPEDQISSENFRIELSKLLTARQTKIRILLEEGKTFPEIAKELGYATKTIQRDRKEIEKTIEKLENS